MRSVIPLTSHIPGLYGRVSRSRSIEEIFFQLGRAIICLKLDRPLPSDLQNFLVDGFRRQIEGLERPGARGQFIVCVEQGKPIPPALRAKIVKWLRRQSDKEVGASGWLGTGRPPKNANWDEMKAWYYYHIDPRFNRLSRRAGDGGRAAKVGAFVGRSERSIHDYQREFARNGFYPTSVRLHDEGLNFTKARMFCRHVLLLPDGGAATEADTPIEGDPLPVDLLIEWKRQGESSKPPPTGEATMRAREILSYWYAQRMDRK